MSENDHETSENGAEEQALDAAIVTMIDRKKEGDHLVCVSEEGFKFLHLLYSAYPSATGPHMKLMFKRSLEMKPY